MRNFGSVIDLRRVETLGTSVGNANDMQNAIRSPLEWWPAYNIMFRMGEPHRRSDHHIFGLHLRIVPPTHAFTQTENADPPSVALRVFGSAIAPPHGSRMTGADGPLEYPLATTNSQVWELRERPVQRDGGHGWRTRTRL